MRPAAPYALTKLVPKKKNIHVDYDVSYGVRCIVPIYGDKQVINLFKRDGKLEAYNLENGNAYSKYRLSHAVVNMSTKPA